VTVRLRGHHLLCILTFVGKGYDGPFVANLARVIDRLAAGEAVLVVDGPDDVCAPLLEGDAPRRLLARIGHRDAFAAGTLRRACAGCRWSDLCTSVAGTGFAGIRL
jgi:hypothetical protein